MRLATSPFREFWGTGEETLLLGPWCLGPGEALGPGETALPCLWDSRTNLDAGIADCSRTAELLVERLGARLNQMHGLSRGERYWRILLGPWALYHTHLTYMAAARLEAAFAAHPGLNTVLLAPRDWKIPYDTPDFVSIFLSDAYNLQLCSALLRALGRDFPEKGLPPNRFPPAPASRGLKAVLRGGVERLANAAMGIAPREILTDSLYPMGRRLWTLAAARPGRLFPLLGDLPPSLRKISIFNHRRKSLDQLPLQGDFGRLLAKTLPWALPTLFLEGFADARRAALARLGRKPRLVLAGSGLQYNELFKLAAAECAEAGARVVGFQHGGGYGSSQAHVVEAHERSVSDAYMTWGWSSAEKDNRLRDVPLPHLPKEAPGPREGILLATTAGLKSPHHLYHSPLEWQWLELFDARDAFLRALPSELRRSLAVRLHPVAGGWGQAERVKAAFPDVALDDFSTPFLERARRARLIVTDHPTTAFLETLALGAPSVHFWREDRWEVRDGARAAFAALKKAKIVHDSPESAARQVAAVYENPRIWWDSPEVRAAREGFTHLFARTGPNWAAAWNKVIDGELADARRQKTS